MPRCSVDGGDQPSIDNLRAGDGNRTEEGNMSQISQWLVLISPGYFYQVSKLHPPLLTTSILSRLQDQLLLTDLSQSFISSVVSYQLKIIRLLIISSEWVITNWRIVIENKSTVDVSYFIHSFSQLSICHNSHPIWNMIPFPYTYIVYVHLYILPVADKCSLVL